MLRPWPNSLRLDSFLRTPPHWQLVNWQDAGRPEFLMKFSKVLMMINNLAFVVQNE
jgi:hypothetical protein